jgi:hypothetical protein
MPCNSDDLLLQVPRHLRRHRPGWGHRLKVAIAKGWARYKFTMTDKQPFRDKLVLPTASINVFLTSLTHVGLSNVGNLLLSSGHLPLNTGAGGWPVPGDGGNWKEFPGGGVVARVDGVSGWRVVGRRIAFREDVIRRSQLTEEIEEEVVEYLKYLVGGGQPIYFATAEAGEVAGGKYTTVKTIKTRPRSRSKSRGPMGIGKHNRTGRMYVVRKKSVSIPSTETFEYVEREYAGRPDGEKMHKSRLELPAPPASGFVDSNDDRQPRYIERRPSGISSDESDGSDSDPGAERYQSRTAASGSRKEKGGSETADRQRDTADARRTERPSGQTYSARDLKDRSRQIRQKIEEERERAIIEIEQRGMASRARAMKSRSRDEPLTEKERKEQAKGDEISETIKFLESEYGVVVIPLEVDREPIDNGRVKPVKPPLASTDFERKELSESDESDTPTLPGMSRTDRLRAETSLPEYSTSTRDRLYKSRNRYEPSRYEPYSTHDQGRFRRSRQSYPEEYKYPPQPSPPPPPPDFFEERHTTTTHHAPPTPLTPSMYDHGRGSKRYHEHARHNHGHFHHHDGGEYFGPTTTPLTREEEDLIYLAQEEHGKSRRRNSTRPIIVTQDDADPSGGLWRRASYGGPDDARRERDLRTREKRRFENEHGNDQHDTYMSGGIGPHGSDDEPEDNIEISGR